MQVDQEVQKAQGDDQKEHAEKKSDNEDMEVCEYTCTQTSDIQHFNKIQMDWKTCISNCSLLVVFYNICTVHGADLTLISLLVIYSI